MRFLKFKSLLVLVLAVISSFSTIAAAQMVQPLDNNRRSVVVEVFDCAKNAVVNISTTQLASVSRGFFGGDMFDDIFPMPMPGLRQNVQVQSLGSGFIIHPDGYVVTNEHVVQRATKISVSLADGSSYDASVVATDNKRDLAVLRLEAPEGKKFTALCFGRSDDIMIGENVIAIGNPKGYTHSVTSGLVSATGRTLEFNNSVQYDGLIQTDAAINPGNSGGPLLNVNAEVIGVNTAIRADAQGIGFAIAADDFARDLPRLMDIKRLKRIDTGMELEVVKGENSALAVRVKSVSADGPAAEAKLAEGMVITAIGTEKLAHPAGKFIELLESSAGDTLEITAVADGKPSKHKLTLRQIPEPDGNALAAKLLGVSLTPVTDQLARRNRLGVREGLMVKVVWQNSPAQELGIQPGDVIFQLGSNYVKNLNQVGRALENVRSGDNVRIGVSRGYTRVKTDITAGDVDVD